MASAFNVVGSELVRSQVRVNPSEQQEVDQQEGQGRGRKEREKGRKQKGGERCEFRFARPGPD